MTSKVPNDLEATQEASLDALPALLDLLISAIQSHTERAGTNFTREAAEDRVDLTLQELGDLLSAALEDEDKSRFSTQDIRLRLSASRPLQDAFTAPPSPQEPVISAHPRDSTQQYPLNRSQASASYRGGGAAFQRVTARSRHFAANVQAFSSDMKAIEQAQKHLTTRKRPRVESDEDGALSKSRARKFGIPKTRESMKRRFSAPNAHNTGADNPTKWMTAVILFNGRGGIFSQTSLDDIRRLWRQYAVHQTGLPKIRGTDAPKDILPVVPRLVDVYTFFAKLKDMESMTSYVANKEYALSFALLGFRKAYDAAGLHYDQDTNARANLRILLGKEFSHQPDSALIKLYLLQKMSESNGIQFKGARRTAPISFFESQLQRAEKYVFLNEIFGPGVLILLPGYIESHELINPLHDGVKDVARAIRRECPDSISLCSLIEEKYATVLRNGGDTKEEMMEDDIELQRLFRSVIKEMSDSGNIVFRANLEGPWKGKL